MKVFLQKTNKYKKSQKSKLFNFKKKLKVKFKKFNFNKNKLLKKMNKINF